MSRELLEFDEVAHAEIAEAEARRAGEVDAEAGEVDIGDIVTGLGCLSCGDELGGTDDLRVVLRAIFIGLGGCLGTLEDPVERIGLVDLVEGACTDAIDLPPVGDVARLPVMLRGALVVRDLAPRDDEVPPGGDECSKR